MEHVLVAVDGMEGSLKAAAFARDLGRRRQVKLTLLHVVEPHAGPLLAELGVSPSDFHSREMDRARVLVRDLARELDIEDAVQVIETGAPSEVICHAADERGADHIVLGAHGLGKHARLMLGSVSARVAAMSCRSVTIVR